MKNIILLAVALLLAVTHQAKAQVPANDNFASRQTLNPGTTSLNIRSATVEAGEPFTTQGHTVWFTYTAPSDVTVTLDNTGTGFGYAFMAVYMGNSINALTDVISGSNSSGNVNVIRRSFSVKAGTTFQISLGRYVSSSAATLPLQISLTTTPFVYSGTLYGPLTTNTTGPSNNLFVNRQILVGNVVTAINYMNDAGVEANEPDTTSGQTIWYSWTATSDSVVTISDTGTDYGYNFISVYMGNTINNLIKITSDYNSSGNFNTNSVTFRTKAGTTYNICSGRAVSSSSNNLFLQLNFSTTSFSYTGTLFSPEVPTAPTPRNDSFYSPQMISGDSLTVIGSNVSATIESGESGINKTLWYSWTPTQNRLVLVNFSADSFAAAGFKAFTGGSVQTATEVQTLSGYSSTIYPFYAVAGTTYKLLVASRSGASGQFLFNLSASDRTQPPPGGGYVNSGGPTSIITSPRNNAKVSKRGFRLLGYANDVDGISQYEVSVTGKRVAYFRPGAGYVSGRLTKKKITVKLRAQDRLGAWGPYTTIKLTVR